MKAQKYLQDEPSEIQKALSFCLLHRIESNINIHIYNKF